MSKIKVNENIYNGKKHHITQYEYMCLGCGYSHVFALTKDGGNHEFNMDLDRPTVSPSLLRNFTPGKTCHSFIRDGKIQYLSDCWHGLAGQTVELPDIK